jgi:hypothetical protein
MQIHRQLLLASSFTILLAPCTVFAQNSATATGSATATVSSNASIHSTVEPSVNGPAGSEDWASMDISSGSFLMSHPRIAKALKFLNNESYRAKIEANMSAADKQIVEATVVDAKSNLETLKALRPQYKTARASQDAATLYQLEKSARPNIDQLIADHRTITDIIAKYKFATPAATTGSMLDPVYPNPVHLGGAPATITYHTQQSGPVKVVLTDASGNTVQEIANDTEGAGDHTVTLGSNLPGAGTYYVTIESNGVKSTQKVAVVQ